MNSEMGDTLSWKKPPTPTGAIWNSFLRPYQFRVRRGTPKLVQLVWLTFTIRNTNIQNARKGRSHGHTLCSPTLLQKTILKSEVSKPLWYDALCAKQQSPNSLSNTCAKQHSPTHEHLDLGSLDFDMLAPVGCATQTSTRAMRTNTNVNKT